MMMMMMMMEEEEEEGAESCLGVGKGMPPSQEDAAALDQRESVSP